MKKLLFICLMVCCYELSAQFCFKAPTAFTTGPTPKSFRNADFDKNGIPDIVTVNCSLSYVSGVTIMMNFNAGTSNFGSINTTNVTSNNQTDIAVADFDGDSLKDLVIVNNNSSGSITFLPGNGTGGIGDGTFGSPVNVAVNNYPSAIAVADFNSDGKQDIAVMSNTSANIAVLTNTSTTVGSFVFSTATVTASSPNAIAAGDFNNDNKPDLAVISTSGNDVLVFTNSSGVFSSYNTYNTGTSSSPTSITLGDFDGVNGLDIATTSSSATTGKITVLLNSGTASFNPYVGYTSSTNYGEGITNGDFDMDGKLDIAIMGYGTSSGLFIFHGTGSGTFAAGVQTLNTSTGGSAPMLKGDYNLDGYPDMAYLLSSNTVDILINAKPKITGATSICIGATTTLTASGATTYTWSTSATTSTVSLSPAVTTTYAVTGAVGTCSASTTSTITVNALPTVTVSASSSSICIGSQATLNSGGASIYTWNPGGTTGSTYVVSPGSTTIYTVTGTDVNGCMNTASVTITANPKPPAFSSVNTPVCAGQALTFTTSTGGATYTWSEPDGSTSSLQNPNIASAAVINSGTYSLTVVSAFGCSNTATVSAVVNPLPTITANSGAICPGGTASLAASGGVAATNYTWTPGGVITTILSASPATTTIYTLAGTSSAGCVGTGTTTVTVFPQAVFAVNSPTICYGSIATLTTTIVTNGTPPYIYNWSNGATTISTTVTPSATTQYGLNLMDANGCVGTGTTVANVTVVNNDDISGTIYDTTTISGLHPIIHGSVYLYTQQNASTAIDTTGLLASGVSVQIQANGSYSFSQVVGGNYYIKAEADTHFYHGSVATYLSTRLNKAYRWDSATVVSHATCGNGIDAGHDISIIELPGLTGTGVISGTITAAPSFGGRYASGGHSQIYGSPLKGIDVKLGKSPGGGCSARTRADTSGAYTFTGVDTGAYSIYVDIPNYGMITILTTTISPTNTQSLNNNYCVDSVAINVCSGALGIKQNVNNNYNASIYPNPNNGVFNLQVAEHENMSVEVYSVIGQKVYAETLQNNLQSLNISTLNDGVYFVRVLKNNSVVYQTKICKQ